MRYDNEVIHSFAERLYNEADLSPLLWGAILGAVGLVFGYLAGRELESYGVVMAIFALLFGALGAFIGSLRARGLRLTAQMALCQAEIEEHLRAMKPAPAPREGPQRRAPNMTPGLFEGR